MKQWYKKVKRFLYEVWLEAKPGGRVNWPDSKKLMESTTLVMLCAVFFMIYVGVLDIIFEQLIYYIVAVFRGGA